jgi:hypothetical protein
MVTYPCATIRHHLVVVRLRINKIGDARVFEVARPAHILFSLSEGTADRMNASKEVVTIGGEDVQDLRTHASLDSRVQYDVEGVGHLDTIARIRRTKGSDRIHEDVHRSAFHTPLEQVEEFFFGLLWRSPVVQRAGFFRRIRANERAAFVPGSIARICAN